MLVSVVRKLADQNRTIVASIHQPSPELYLLFDKVIILSFGRVIFFGSSLEAMSYFTQSELGYQFNFSQSSVRVVIFLAIFLPFFCHIFCHIFCHFFAIFVISCHFLSILSILSILTVLLGTRVYFGHMWRPNHAYWICKAQTAC